MIWYFTRGAAQIDVEVLRRSEANGYTLALTYSDGTERIEQFESPARLVARALAIQQRLIAEGWMPASPATGKTMVPRRVPCGRIRYAATAARRALAHLHRSITKRLAAAFGL
jgi:hypothetical protein